MVLFHLHVCLFFVPGTLKIKHSSNRQRVVRWHFSRALQRYHLKVLNLHLASMCSYSMFVFWHYLFLKAHSFPDLPGTDQIAISFPRPLIFPPPGVLAPGGGKMRDPGTRLIGLMRLWLTFYRSLVHLTLMPKTATADIWLDKKVYYGNAYGFEI